MLKAMTKHENKEHGKTPKHEAPCSIINKATQNKNNTETTALERSDVCKQIVHKLMHQSLEIPAPTGPGIAGT